MDVDPVWQLLPTKSDRIKAAIRAPSVTPHGLQYCSMDLTAPTGNKHLVCIHGWGCKAIDFTDLFCQLHELDFPHLMTTVGLPGHGWTNSATAPVPSVAAITTLILELVMRSGTAAETKEVVLLAHGPAASVAFELVNQAKLIQSTSAVRITGLILLDAGDTRINLLQGVPLLDPHSCTLGFFSAQTPAPFIEAAQAHMRGLAGNSTSRYIEKLGRNLKHWWQDNFDFAVRGLDGLRVLNVESTHLKGFQQRFPLDVGDETKLRKALERAVPASRTEHVTSSGYFPHVDQVDAVADLIMEFMDGDA